MTVQPEALGEDGHPMPRNLSGAKLAVEITIGYPGTTVSDILIGGFKVQIPNDVLRAIAVRPSE